MTAADRTPADRIAAVVRHGQPLTNEQLASATALLADLYATAARQGTTPEDLDWVVDLPGVCLDVIKR